MSRFQDLTGQVFNNLTVIRRSEKNSCNHAAWICMCICGRETRTSSSHLKSKHTTSCGCCRESRKLVNRTGIRYGSLVVLDRVENKNGRVRWRCQCDCGQICITDGANLGTGNSTSCGCQKRIVPGAAFRQLLGSYKNEAKQRGIKWNLTDEQFRQLTSSPCYYTGRFPQKQSIAKSGETYTYNGIDRLDSDGDYFWENCVPCCREVNFMKGSMSEQDFYSLCEEILKHRLSKNGSY